MIICSLDLELNEPETKQRIIQIGYCFGDVYTGEISLTRRLYISLPENETLQDEITKLTGITKEDLQAFGTTIEEACETILKDFEAINVKWIPFIQWGHGDDKLLKPFFADKWPFGRASFDVKKLYQSYRIANKLNLQGGLKKSCNKLGVSFKGPAHDALNDAIGTFDIFRALLCKFNTAEKHVV